MKLINVCKHLLANPDLLNDKMYRKQVKQAIKDDTDSWDLMVNGRECEQGQLCEFLNTILNPICKELKQSKNNKLYQYYVDINEGVINMMGAEITENTRFIPPNLQP